jgi:hypothetical protein
MVYMIIVYLHNGRQRLLRGEGTGEHFLGQNECSCAPVFGDSPPTSTFFLTGASTKRTRRSSPRAGPRVGASHQPQMSDDPMLPQRLRGTCQRWRCWRSVCTRTPALPACELRGLRQGLAVSLALLKESIGFPLLVMGDLPVRPTPELRKPLRLWSVGGSRHAPPVIVPFRPPLTHQLCSCWSAGAQVGDAPTPPAPPGAANLGRRARGPAALSPAIAPVHTLAALDLSVALRALPPALPLSAQGDTLHVVREDGARTGPRPRDRQRRRAEGIAALPRLGVLLQGAWPRHAQWQAEGAAYQRRYPWWTSRGCCVGVVKNPNFTAYSRPFKSVTSDEGI